MTNSIWRRLLPIRNGPFVKRSDGTLSPNAEYGHQDQRKQPRDIGLGRGRATSLCRATGISDSKLNAFSNPGSVIDIYIIQTQWGLKIDEGVDPDFQPIGPGLLHVDTIAKSNLQCAILKRAVQTNTKRCIFTLFQRVGLN